MKKFDCKVMGERLKTLRTEKNIGQNKLAADIEVSNASISYWENGKQEPSAQALFKLALYFDVSVDYILGITDD
ncbi:MAG: helix-turn-helix transcriptional regulator [Clostridia bacterium]|nr:helix-turn-helix transcriptional regulator [Clostridia bacterium]